MTLFFSKTAILKINVVIKQNKKIIKCDSNKMSKLNSKLCIHCEISLYESIRFCRKKSNKRDLYSRLLRFAVKREKDF